MIIADFPGLLGEFREKRFTLLWRGGRFGAGVLSDAKLFGVSSELSEITLMFRDRELAVGESRKERSRFDAEMNKTTE
jgi:hypothetical protein